MNNRVQEFLSDLFKDKEYSWIFDLESGTIYFNPKEILSDCGYTERAIEDKVSQVPNEHKRFFTNGDLIQGTVSNVGLKIASNYGQNWVTVYALIDMLQGRKPKATEIKNWLIYEVLPSIDKNGYYIDENITSEQVEKLEKEIAELKAERTKKVYGSTDIVKMIKVPNLLSSTLFRYIAEEMKLGTYDVEFGNVNRTFVPNEDFTERAIKVGIARGGKGRDILFYKDFAECFNNCKDALKRLYEINQEEIAIRNKGKEKRRKNMPF